MNDDQEATDRRGFLKQSLLGTTALGTSLASTTEVTMAAEAGTRGPEVTNEVDVLVVGGGTAGNIAAIQAGRAGASCRSR